VFQVDDRLVAVWKDQRLDATPRLGRDWASRAFGLPRSMGNRLSPRK
jgi:hypothetical protein